RLASRLTYARHRHLTAIHFRQRAQISDHQVDVLQDLLVAQVTARVASRQRLAIARETPEEIGNDRHVAGVDKLLPQIRGVLDDAVALVEMNDRRPFATTGGLAEKSVDAIVDLHWSEHSHSS